MLLDDSELPLPAVEAGPQLGLAGTAEEEAEAGRALVPQLGQPLLELAPGPSPSLPEELAHLALVVEVLRQGPAFRAKGDRIEIEYGGGLGTWPCCTMVHIGF